MNDLMVTENVLIEGPATYWAFDPGETTGFAWFDEHGNLMRAGQIYGFDSVTTFMEQSDSSKLKTVVCEIFVILRKKAPKFAGNKMEVLQVQGNIRGFAGRVGAKFVEQRSDIKPNAQRLTGVFPKGKHSETHWVDAFNHGAYYLIRIGVKKARYDTSNR